MLGLYKEISYLSTGSLRTDILEKAPMIIFSFMDTFLSIFIYCFPMKKR